MGQSCRAVAAAGAATAAASTAAASATTTAAAEVPPPPPRPQPKPGATRPGGPAAGCSGGLGGGVQLCGAKSDDLADGGPARYPVLRHHPSPRSRPRRPCRSPINVEATWGPFRPQQPAAAEACGLSGCMPSLP